MLFETISLTVLILLIFKASRRPHNFPPGMYFLSLAYGIIIYIVLYNYGQIIYYIVYYLIYCFNIGIYLSINNEDYVHNY